MAEIVIKILISIPIILTIVFSGSLLLRLWHTQIDTHQSVKLWLGSQLSLSDWISTRDQDLIYQNGRPVGFVEKDPIFDFKISKIIFPRVRHISYIDIGEKIEYRRYVCNKVNSKGTESVQGFDIIGWYIDLECEIE